MDPHGPKSTAYVLLASTFRPGTSLSSDPGRQRRKPAAGTAASDVDVVIDAQRRKQSRDAAASDVDALAVAFGPALDAQFEAPTRSAAYPAPSARPPSLVINRGIRCSRASSSSRRPWLLGGGQERDPFGAVRKTTRLSAGRADVLVAGHHDGDVGDDTPLPMHHSLRSVLVRRLVHDVDGRPARVLVGGEEAAGNLRGLIDARRASPGGRYGTPRRCRRRTAVRPGRRGRGRRA